MGRRCHKLGSPHHYNLAPVGQTGGVRTEQWRKIVRGPGTWRGRMRRVTTQPARPIRQGLASPPVSPEKANAAIRTMLLGKQQNKYCILGGHLVCEAGNEALNNALGRDVGMVSYSSIGRDPLNREVWVRVPLRVTHCQPNINNQL